MQYVHVALAEVLCLALHMHGLWVILEEDAGSVLKTFNFTTHIVLRMATTAYTMEWLRTRSPFVWDIWRCFYVWCGLMVYPFMYDAARLLDPRAVSFVVFGYCVPAGPSHPLEVLGGVTVALLVNLAFGRAVMEWIVWMQQCINRCFDSEEEGEDKSKGYDEMA